MVFITVNYCCFARNEKGTRDSENKIRGEDFFSDKMFPEVGPFIWYNLEINFADMIHMPFFKFPQSQILEDLSWFCVKDIRILLHQLFLTNNKHEFYSPIWSWMMVICSWCYKNLSDPTFINFNHLSPLEDQQFHPHTYFITHSVTSTHNNNNNDNNTFSSVQIVRFSGVVHCVQFLYSCVLFVFCTVVFVCAFWIY